MTCCIYPVEINVNSINLDTDYIKEQMIEPMYFKKPKTRWVERVGDWPAIANKTYIDRMINTKERLRNKLVAKQDN